MGFHFFACLSEIWEIATSQINVLGVMIPTSCSYKNVQKDIPFLREPIKHVYIQNMNQKGQSTYYIYQLSEKNQYAKYF